jgi:hypothetical protein
VPYTRSDTEQECFLQEEMDRLRRLREEYGSALEVFRRWWRD